MRAVLSNAVAWIYNSSNNSKSSSNGISYVWLWQLLASVKNSTCSTNNDNTN